MEIINFVYGSLLNSSNCLMRGCVAYLVTYQQSIFIVHYCDARHTGIFIAFVIKMWIRFSIIAGMETAPQANRNQYQSSLDHDFLPVSKIIRTERLRENLKFKFGSFVLNSLFNLLN